MKENKIAVGTYKNSSKPKWKTEGIELNEALDFLDIDKTHSCASEKRGAIEVVRKYINECNYLKRTILGSYEMLIQHINIYEESKQRHYEETRKLDVLEQCYENGKFSENLALSKEIKGLLEAKFSFLKSDNIQPFDNLLQPGKSSIQSIKFENKELAEKFQAKVGFKTVLVEDDEKGIYYVVFYLNESELE